MTIKHSPECLAVQKAFAEWIEKYPGYCRKCLGHGFLYFPGNRDEPPDSDVCSCLISGKCPRCGSPVTTVERFEGDVSTCQTCGWSDEWLASSGAIPTSPPADFSAPAFDCLCDFDPDPDLFYPGE